MARESFIWPLYQARKYLIILSLMTLDSNGILVVAYVALRISDPGASHLASLSGPKVPDYFIPHDLGFEWNSCCGFRGVENLWPGSLLFGISIRAEII